MTRDAFIFDAIRTPRGRGKSSGALYEIKPIDLVTQLLRELQRRNGFATDEVDDIILGCVTPIGDQGANLAKTAALYAGYAETVAGQQINRFCASGLEAVNHAAMRVRSGWEDLVIGGGVESMSRVPMGSDGGPMMLDPKVSATLRFVPQGIGADLIATLENFSREDVDAYALRSHQRAAQATANGYFQRSLIPVTDFNGMLVLDRDEHIRPDTTLEALAQLKPSFAEMGGIGFDAGGAVAVSRRRADSARPHGRQLVWHCGWCGRWCLSEAGKKGEGAGSEAPRPDCRRGRDRQ